MTINWIPNDPLSQVHIPIREVEPRPDRPSSRARFQLSGSVPEDRYDFATEPDEFVHWQCREAALAAVDAWEALDGPLTRWQGNKRILRLRPNDGIDLNAFYNRRSLSFFEHTTGSKTTYSGASTDVVAHEAGHALLDAMRSELFVSNVTELDAFHEAFGDCIAIVTALADRETRETLLGASADLRSANFVEATAEDLSDGVRRAAGASHPAAAPRRALNSFQWQLPATLPVSAPPAQLSSEIHSFGRIFSGCFYDTLSNIFASLPAQTEATLWEATETAAKLLIAAARAAPLDVRFFRSVGRAMILADDDQNAGANHLAIRDAFNAHNIALGSSAMLAETAVLQGAAPKVAARAKPRLAAATRSDLMKRIGAAKGAKLGLQAVRLAGRRVVQAVHERMVRLDKVDKRLKRVVAMAPESIMVGAARGRAAILGALPDSQATDDEVTTFVKTLVEHDCIRFAKSQSAVSDATQRMRTHEIRSVRGRRILTRVAYDCGGRL